MKIRHSLTPRHPVTCKENGVIGCLIFVGHFPLKSPVISGSFPKMTYTWRNPTSLPPPCNECVNYWVRELFVSTISSNSSWSKEFVNEWSRNFWINEFICISSLWIDEFANQSVRKLMSPKSWWVVNLWINEFICVSSSCINEFANQWVQKFVIQRGRKCASSWNIEVVCVSWCHENKW